MTTRRHFLKHTATAAAALLAAPRLLGCGAESEDADSATNPEWESRASELEAGGVFTTDQPGKWAGKEGSHVPVLALIGRTATVSVGHGMADDHWITTIYLRDQDGVVIGLTELGSSAVEAKASFDLPASTSQVTAYAACNLHDLWAGSSVGARAAGT